MSKFKLHPLTVCIAALKSLKGVAIPFVIILFANGFQISFDIRSDEFWEQSFTLILFVVIFVVVVSASVIKWLTYRYWFEQEELRIEYGIFVKKKRYIPFERIQNLNYQESVLHRLFGLVQVFVETAGSKNGKAEAELTAITRAAADQIELEMNSAKHGVAEVVIEAERPIIYKMSLRQLLIVAATSNSIGVVLAGGVAIISQFSQYIPFEAIFDELAYIVRFSFVVVLLLAVVFLLVVWLIAVLLTAVNYYQFTIMKEDERIIVTRGLFEKKRITLPTSRIQAIRVVENPMRQLFGLCTVVVESAGGNFSGEQDRKIVLLPLISKKRIAPILKELLSSYQFDVQPAIASPRHGRAFFYRLQFVYIVPVITLLSYYFYPYGLLSLLIVAANIALGIWQHRAAAFSIDGQQLTIRYRIVSRVTFYVPKNRIQALERQQTYFQKRKHIASCRVVVMSGTNGAAAKAYHMDEQQIKQLMTWYRQRK